MNKVMSMKLANYMANYFSEWHEKKSAVEIFRDSNNKELIQKALETLREPVKRFRKRTLSENPSAEEDIIYIGKHYTDYIIDTGRLSREYNTQVIPNINPNNVGVVDVFYAQAMEIKEKHLDHLINTKHIPHHSFFCNE